MKKQESVKQRVIIVFCGLFLCVMVPSIVLSSALFTAPKPTGQAVTLPIIGSPTDLCVEGRGGNGPNHTPVIIDGTPIMNGTPIILDGRLIICL